MMKTLLSMLLLCLSAQVLAQAVLYSQNSPWNQPIRENPPIDPDSSRYVQAIQGHFGSRTDKYTFPVYRVDADTPTTTVRIRGFWSDVSQAGEKLEVSRKTGVRLPIPADAIPAKGKDAHLVLWNTATGDEWGLWHVRRTRKGWEAENGYHYNTRWNAVPPKGFISRGAGIPYLAGLIFPHELQAGAIEHALALGINYPSPLHVHPATKSDGRSYEAWSLPMGSRLQLDPRYTEADFKRWGLDRSGRIIARALQRYGMIVVDGSGHPKLYGEYDGTAEWDGLLRHDTVKRIPYEAFRVLASP